MLVIKLSQLGSLFLFVIFMNIDNRDLKQGQTMFDYLKRKKRAALQKTLNRGAFNTSRQPLHDKSMSQFNTDFEKTRREDSQGLSSKTTNRGKSPQLQNISTRRNIIQDQDRKSNQRSFIQMISPIRSKSPAKEAQKSVSKQQNVKKDPYRENYTKKMLTQKINMTRSVIEGLSKAGRSLKQKAHLLFLDLKTVLRHIDNCEDAGIEKKTDEIKAKIRALQTIFKQFNSNDSQTNLNEFYMHFSQYLNQLEGKAKAQIQQNRGNVTQQISNAKNIQIDQLKQQKFKLQKQLSINLKKNSRLEKENEELQIHIQNLQEKWSKKYEEKSIKLQQHINSLKQENIKLKQELQGMIQTIRNLQEERKSLVHQKQKFQQQCLNTITRVKSQQQQFLLHQIVIIKKQFSNDITKMTQLFKIKQDSYIRRIEQHQNQNSKMRRHLVDSHEDCKKISQSMQAVQAQNIRLKKQNECLATDMHRINEELYQHWLALKDIKTLSQRLDIFQKFRKIYEDLLFNQQLFL